MLKPYTLHSLRKRILTLLVLISFLFCSLVIRLFVVQIINGKSLQLKATDQWTRDIQIIAPRGNIYDKTGSTLATSYTTYNVYTRPREILGPLMVTTSLIPRAARLSTWSFIRLCNGEMTTEFLRLFFLLII